MFLFVIAFFTLYLLLSYYVAYNGWIWLSNTFGIVYKKTYYILMLFATISFFLNQIAFLPVINWLGYIWLLVLGLSLAILPIINFVYLINKKRGLKWFGYGVLSFYFVIIIIGSFMVWVPTVVRYDVELSKQTELDQLKILLVSDIHINELINTNHLKRLKRIAREVDPDIIFLAGDTIDRSMDPYFKHNLGEILSGLTAPLGVYATLGNHEYYSGDIPTFLAEMNEINVTVLTDEVVDVNGLFYILGRKDYIDDDRVEIVELTKNLDKDKPIFLIDHQPREYDEVSVAGVDVMMSGHTHRGQLFPGNLVTNAIYDNHYGYVVFDQLHTIVSSGFGLWGPPFRIGSRSEAVEINVHFK